VIILLLVFVTIATTIDLNCDFILYSIDGYNCKAENIKTEENNRNLQDVKGLHLKGRNNGNVDTLYFPSSDCMTFLPSGVGKIFPNLKKFEISHGSLKYITQSDFAGLKSLQTIFIMKTLLSSIPEDAFNSLSSLETLKLSDNKIRDLKMKTFENLSSLKKLSLSENSLEILPSKIFEKNLKLEEIDLSNNKLRVIEAETINSLKNLKKISFVGNFCVWKNFPVDLTLTELGLEIVNKCTNDIEIVKSSTLTEMNHEFLVLRQYVNSSSQKMEGLEGNLAKLRMKMVKIESENRGLINDGERLRVNSSILNEKNEDLFAKLNGAYVTIKTLKDNLDITAEKLQKTEENLMSHREKYLKLEQNYNEQEILRRNESVESFETAESSQAFIKTAQITSSSLFTILLVMVTSLTGNILLIIVIIRVSRNKKVQKPNDSEMSVRSAHDKQ
jgi:hypothetical protein